MPRHARLAVPFVPLHIRQRGIDRSPCFQRDADYDLYTGLMSELVGKARCQLHAYVLMPNHVHLLITPKIEPPVAPRKVKGASAREANRLLGVTGRPFWQDESYDHLVRSQEQFERIGNYILQNPVRAGLVRSEGEYRWSSAFEPAG